VNDQDFVGDCPTCGTPLTQGEWDALDDPSFIEEVEYNAAKQAKRKTWTDAADLVREIREKEESQVLLWPEKAKSIMATVLDYVERCLRAKAGGEET
jgi:hypothetical protein